MLGIVMFHMTYHDILEQLVDPNYGRYFNLPMFFRTLLVLVTLMTLGPVGNSIFLILSGYFTCNGDKPLNLTGIGSKLMTQLVFASIVLIVGSPIVRCFVSVDTMQYKGLQLMDVTIFNEKSWYLGFYFIVMVIAALYLNQFLAKLDRPQYIAFLVVLFALTQCVYSGEMLHDTIGHGKQIVYGVMIYALGGAIRRFHLFDKVRTWVFVATLLATYALTWLSFYNSTMVRIDRYIQVNGDNIFVQSIPYPDDSSLIILVIALSVFELFRRMPQFKSRVINYIGSATFMVYLLHDNETFMSLWDMQHWTEMLSRNKPLFVHRFLMWAFATFACGVVCYVIYQALGRLLRRCRAVFVTSE